MGNHTITNEKLLPLEPFRNTLSLGGKLLYKYFPSLLRHLKGGWVGKHRLQSCGKSLCWTARNKLLCIRFALCPFDFICHAEP